MNNNLKFIEPDLTIGQLKECNHCGIARPRLLLINCCKCGGSYCFGFINHWNIVHKEGCNPKNVKYVSVMTYDEYSFDEAEKKSLIFSNPENNSIEYNKELLKFLENNNTNIYQEILKRIKNANPQQYKLLNTNNFIINNKNNKEDEQILNNHSLIIKIVTSHGGNDNIFGVDVNNFIYKYLGNNRWKRIDGNLKQIDSGKDGELWGVNEMNKIYRYLGNNNWENIEGSLKYISVGSKNHVWGVNSSDDIFRYLGNNKWQQISGKLKCVSVSYEGNVIWGVNSNNEIWRYLGNNNWQKIDGGLKQLTISADGTWVYGVNNYNQVWRRRTDLTSQWEIFDVNEQPEYISVYNHNNEIWGVNRYGKPFKY